MKNFSSIEAIFLDNQFDSLIEEIKPRSVDRVDPELEKFQEILAWIEINNRLPQKSVNLVERRLFSRLKGICANPDKLERFKSYDEKALLGEYGDE
ncbi:hypothetical protein [Streptococcus pluranimalium]|uniref:hypothetical protein n=1 Tax=Streptococcus pluranimalium TaxID=82348 RepID=UPI003138AC6F